MCVRARERVCVYVASCGISPKQSHKVREMWKSVQSIRFYKMLVSVRVKGKK